MRSAAFTDPGNTRSNRKDHSFFFTLNILGYKLDRAGLEEVCLLLRFKKNIYFSLIIFASFLLHMHQKTTKHG